MNNNYPKFLSNLLWGILFNKRVFLLVFIFGVFVEFTVFKQTKSPLAFLLHAPSGLIVLFFCLFPEKAKKNFFKILYAVTTLHFVEVSAISAFIEAYNPDFNRASRSLPTQILLPWLFAFAPSVSGFLALGFMANLFNGAAYAVLLPDVFTAVIPTAATMMAIGIFLSYMLNHLVRSRYEIEEKKKVIEAQNAKMKSILSTSTNAVFLFGPDGQKMMQNFVLPFLPNTDSVKQFLTELGVPPHEVEAVSIVLWEDDVAWDFNSENFPSNIKFQNRSLLLSFGKVLSGQKISGLTLNISDLTDYEASKELAKVAVEEALIVQKIVHDASEYRSKFAIELEKNVAKLRSGVDVKRTLHTFKGIANSLHFNELGTLIHEAESSGDIEPVLAYCDRVSDLYKKIFPGKSATRSFDIEAAFRSLENRTTEAFVKSLVYTHAHDVVRHNPTVKNVEEIAKKLDKGAPHVNIVGENPLFTPEQAEVIDTVLTHSIRNALDHGIERAEIRVGKGKSEAGVITIEFSKDGFAVFDDGAGLNLEKLAKKSNVKLDNSADVAQLIFAPGLSTKDTVSEISGRGIGLDAASESVRTIGWKIAAEDRGDNFGKWALKVEF